MAEIASVGKVGRAEMVSTAQPAAEQVAETVEKKDEGTAAVATATTTDNGTAAATTATEEKKTEFTDDELKELYNKRFPTTQEPTPEELAAKEKVLDEKMLKVYLDNGGTIESYATIKQILSADLTELSERELVEQLTKEGFDKEDIAAIKKERFYQIELSELEQGEDESDEDFAKKKAKIEKKIAYGAKELASLASNHKKSAEALFNKLKKSVEEENSLDIKENEFASKVDAHFKELPRKMTLQLGQVADGEIAPIEYEVNEADLESVKNLLKNKDERNKLLFTESGELNLESIAEMLLAKQMSESAVKRAYLTASTREVEKFEKIFPYRNANGVGVNGGANKPNGKKPKITGFGKPQVVRQTG